MTKKVVIDGVEYVPKRELPPYIGEITGAEIQAERIDNWAIKPSYIHKYFVTLTLNTGKELKIEVDADDFVLIKEAVMRVKD